MKRLVDSLASGHGKAGVPPTSTLEIPAVTLDGEVAGEERLLVVGPDDGLGAVRLVRTTLQSWSRSVSHRDPDSDQLIMVLSGCARVRVDDGPTVVLAPNEVVHVPRGTSHLVEAADAHALEILILSSP